MATQWTTFPMEFKGGLISNLTPLQQGTNAVGSATILQNFESDREGGYSKLKGYDKFSTTKVPGGGEVLAMKVVSSGRVVTARKMDTATVTEYQTATSTVNGAVSSATAVSLDNNTATAIVNGAITSKTTVVVDRVRAFTGLTGTASATGASGTFDITNTNGTYTAAVNAAGTGYAVNETVTVVGANLGGATAANNATVTVSSIAPTTHTTPANTYNGSAGTGLTFNVTRTGAVYSVAIVSAGTGGYKVGETVTVAGAALGGATTANNATITVGSINNVAVTYTNPTQSAYSGSGSSATFNVIKTGTTYTVAITAAGSGYTASETIKVVGTQLNGATTANDATITITTVDGSGGITGATIAGTGLAEGTVATAAITGTAINTGPITGVTVAGTGASFGTITKGMVVTGTGITGEVTVKTVTNQNSIILDTARLCLV